VTELTTTSVAPRAFSIPRPPVWILGWWLAGRVVVVAVAFAVRPTIWTLDRWDGSWYLRVARGGYLLVPGRQSDPAFFPLYPIVLRTLHHLGLSWEVVGPVVSNAALLLGLVLFHALSREVMGAAIARRATTYLAIFPLAFVFSMAYPESLALVFICGAPLAAMRRHWWLAAACAACAVLTRPEAIFLALPLAGIAWSQRRELGVWSRGGAIAATLAPLAALGGFSLYLATVLNEPLAWTKAESAWGRSFYATGLFRALAHLPFALFAGGWGARNAIFFVLYLVLFAVAWRAGVPKLWIAAGAGAVVLPVFSGEFTSDARFGLLAPALIWALASITEKPWARRTVIALSLSLLVLGTLSLPHVVP
jgi:hypothetical protein